MSNMTFLTQQQEVASQLRLDLTLSANATLVKRWLNQSQREIWAERSWNFSVERAVVQTVTDATAGTVSATVGSAVITGSGTAFSSSNVGSFIQLSTSNDWYKIVSVQSATQLTMETNFVGSTALSGGTYTIRQIFYSLPSGSEKILDARQTISPTYIEPVFYRDFDIFRPNPFGTGNPNILIVYGLDSSGNIKFTLYPFPGQVENIEIRYKKQVVDLSADADVSLIPDKWAATVMIDGALYRGITYLATSDPKYLPIEEVLKNRFYGGLNKMSGDLEDDESYHPIMENRDRINTPVGPVLPFKYGADKTAW